ncbi:hypothetical protein N3K66_002255 [Trichothecium roseum]|uniref:Uncharacterized protein n=1 Tax=Trichothecium roseum TaxID=47278 RepID=A0ACC0VBR6_9HYPO|nr:hypothetical protein N3K66_002255 [Trichothecium roseum]
MSGTAGKTSHLERTAEEPRDKDLYKVKLGSIEQVNEDIRLIRLHLPKTGAKFLPGQWLDTYVPSTPRAGGFTITSPPSRASSNGSGSGSGSSEGYQEQQEQGQPYLELAVQKSPSNPPAEFLFRPEASILGSALHVRVGGSFTYPPKIAEDAAQVKRVVFVAGGVGINPLTSMLSHIAEEGEAEGGSAGLRPEVKVLYGVRVPKKGGAEGILFLERISRLLLRGKLNGGLELFVTGAGQTVEVPEGSPVKVHRRRITVDDVAAAVGNGPQDRNSSIVYICGPPTMTDELVERLTSTDGVGLDAARVLTEKWW